MVERAVVVSVDAFDWNCPQHISPGSAPPKLEPTLADMWQRLSDVEAENTASTSSRADLTERARLLVFVSPHSRALSLRTWSALAVGVDRFGPRHRSAALAVLIPAGLPIYLFWSFLIVALEGSSRYLQRLSSPSSPCLR